MTTEKKKETKTDAVIDVAVEEAKVVVEEKIIDAETEKQINLATVKKVRAMFNDNEAMVLTEAAIQNNEIPFEVNGKNYRVRKANFQEKQDANKYRMKIYVDLLRDKDCLLEKDLKKLYKDRGINIDDMDKQIMELSNQQQKLLFDLGKAIKENKPKVELDKYKEEVIILMHSIQGLSLEKQQLLEFSLENRVMMEVYSYLIWAVAEIKIGDKWQRIWSTQTEFLNTTPDELLTQVTKNATVLITEDLASNSMST